MLACPGLFHATGVLVVCVAHICLIIYPSWFNNQAASPVHAQFNLLSTSQLYCACTHNDMEEI